MQAIDAEAVPSRQSSILEKLWHKTKTWIIVSTLLGLVSLNILTLVSDEIHAAGYGVIKAVLASTLKDETLSRLLSNSPTFKRKSDVAVATKALSDEKSMISASKRVLEVKHASLEKTNEENKGKHSELMRISGIRSSTVQNISKRLATRSVINATRNASSVFAEAIPVAGVAIVVGVTVLDLHDACETLKDLNKVNIVFGHEQEDQAKVCGMKVPSKEEAMDQVKSTWMSTYQAAADALKKGGAMVTSATLP